MFTFHQPVSGLFTLPGYFNSTKKMRPAVVTWNECPYKMVDPELPLGGGLRLTIVVLVCGFWVVAVVVDLAGEVGTTVVVVCAGTVISTSPAKSKLSGSPISSSNASPSSAASCLASRASLVMATAS